METGKKEPLKKFYSRNTGRLFVRRAPKLRITTHKRSANRER